MALVFRLEPFNPFKGLPFLLGSGTDDKAVWATVIESVLLKEIRATGVGYVEKVF